MIRITVEMVPRGDERDAYTIGHLTIANTEGTPDIANYSVTGYTQTAAGEVVAFAGNVYNHKRGAGIWVLILKALEACNYKKE